MLVGALQPGYLPWLGFFDQADRADVFVLYDDLPFDRRSWRQRNRIKTPRGLAWLSVPIAHRHGSELSPPTILDAPIAAGYPWRHQHWEALRHCYRHTPHFAEHASFFDDTYRRPWTRLGDLTLHLTDYLMAALGITSTVVRSSDTLRTSPCWKGPRDATTSRKTSSNARASAWSIRTIAIPRIPSDSARSSRSSRSSICSSTAGRRVSP